MKQRIPFSVGINKAVKKMKNSRIIVRAGHVPGNKTGHLLPHYGFPRCHTGKIFAGQKVEIGFDNFGVGFYFHNVAVKDSNKVPSKNCLHMFLLTIFPYQHNAQAMLRL